MTKGKGHSKAMGNILLKMVPRPLAKLEGMVEPGPKDFHSIRAQENTSRELEGSKESREA